MLSPPFVPNSNIFLACFYQCRWNPFEVNGNASVLIKNVGFQVSTEYMVFLQTTLGPAFHVKKYKLIGLVKASFWFTAVSLCSVEVSCIGYEFSTSFSVSKRGALADLSLCQLCETVRELMFLRWT